MNILKRRKRRKLRKILLFVLILFFTFTGLVGYGIYQTVAQSVHNMYKPLQKDTAEQQTEEYSNPKPISFLLIGVDERKGDVGRSDTLVVVNVNPETKTSTLLSIPRDTRVFIESQNSYHKINSAYVYDGVEGAVQAVEQFLDTPIDYYIKVNMEGFKDIVDAVGGVTINNPFAFNLEGVYIPEGEQHIDGEVALKYVRMRKEDPLGDFGRQKRQREVISQIIHEGTKISSLTKYPKILKVLEKNVQTNLTLNQIMDIQREYKDAVKTINQLEIEGEGKKVDGLWYYLVSEETRLEISKQLGNDN